MQADRLSEIVGRVVRYRESKGFKTGLENLREKLALVNSEIYGAVDSAQAGFQFDQDSRPLGFHWENFQRFLTDAQLRLFDLFGSLGIDAVQELKPKTLSERVMQARAQRPVSYDWATITGSLLDVNSAICMADDIWRGPEEQQTRWEHLASGLLSASGQLFQLANSLSWDLIKSLDERMKFNESRLGKYKE